MYEAKHQRLLTRANFYRRVGTHVAIAGGLLIISLGIGMFGYMVTEGLSPVDAFLDAAMLLGGMGPITHPTSVGGKLFAGMYALYAGLVFIVCTALILTPVVHRVLHHFHVGEKE